MMVQKEPKENYNHKKDAKSFFICGKIVKPNKVYFYEKSQ